MPVVRIYLPIGRRELDALATTGSLDASEADPRPAFAVTDALRVRAPGLDLEELEYAAFSDAVAAAASARARRGHRRVVAAADADPGWLSPRDGASVTAVHLVRAVPVNRVASFHVDEDEDQGESSGGDELLWYDVTELDEVRRLLS